MLATEYVRNLNSNYARLQLPDKPDENRYQYNIISRGGITGLLECDVRFINGVSYLYYNISSKQNLPQIISRTKIDREWVGDFATSMKGIRKELYRFLLEDKGIVWYPQYIFKDPDSKRFNFMYIPYYEEDNGFKELMDFLIENMDYNDASLVDLIFRIYDRYERQGEVYLEAQLYTDLDTYFSGRKTELAEELQLEGEDCENESPEDQGLVFGSRIDPNRQVYYTSTDIIDIKTGKITPGPGSEPESIPNRSADKKVKGGLIGLWGARKRRAEERREQYGRKMKLCMEGQSENDVFGLDESAISGRAMAVAEESPYHTDKNAQARRLAPIEAQTPVKGLAPVKDSLTTGSKGFKLSGKGKYIHSMEGTRMSVMYEDHITEETVSQVAAALAEKDITVRKGNDDEDVEAAMRTLVIEGIDEEVCRKHKLVTEDGLQEAELNEVITVIGKKKSEVDIMLPESSISRIHCRIVRDFLDFFLEDLNSTNGTFLNGIRLAPYERRTLNVGDEIRLGKVVLTYM